MLEHAEVWRAIDRLAEQNGLSASGLARRAGLDATTFNPSKRKTPSGRERWPSTESLSKILSATGFSLAEFVALIGQKAGGLTMQRVPVIKSDQAVEDGFFDSSGNPVGDGWDEALFPDVGDPHAYALQISDNSLSPVCREGDLVVVSPTTELRRGDRAIVKTRENRVLSGEVVRKAMNRLELRSFDRSRQDVTLLDSDIEWSARILWAQQ